MKPQSIVTEAGEELVVLSRTAYDALLARAGDEAAEDRMAARMIDAHLADKANGRAVLLPDWLAEALAEGSSALQSVREHRRLTQGELARAADLPPSYVGEVERGEKSPSAAALARIAAVLDCDPAWLD